MFFSIKIVGHVLQRGDCPLVEPMADFEIDQFVGQWYVIQKFQSYSDCVRENFTMIQQNQYIVTRQFNVLGSPILTTVTGKIIFPKNESKSEMSIDYPLSASGVVNIRQYTVLATDYDNYALVWNCKPLVIRHRQSAQIMSRRPKLDPKIVDELRELLREFNINDHYLTNVSQSHCPSSVDTSDQSMTTNDNTVNNNNIDDNNNSDISTDI
ncbi:apolipoprotein D-like [Oppia nitens]|uniref:apolipoprotein D-like n=1 Tax=Oppia nitens TaxID=1686743 RepID=UPI0023DA0134|nr:apolipoprotein D-like [Oppia nitens]